MEKLILVPKTIQSPVEYSKYTVPVCLPDSDHFDYAGFKAVQASFASKSFSLAEPRKSEQLLSLLGDEECKTKLNEGSGLFDPLIQICTYHEAENATGDFTGVINRFKKRVDFSEVNHDIFFSRVM
jgi:hypothetical protein